MVGTADSVLIREVVYAVSFIERFHCIGKEHAMYFPHSAAESGVFGWKRCGDYFCFNRGSCENGTCVCAEGFGGAYCELSTGEHVSHAVKCEEYNY